MNSPKRLTACGGFNFALVLSAEVGVILPRLFL
jgi:hypothetical protein